MCLHVVCSDSKYSLKQTEFKVFGENVWETEGMEGFAHAECILEWHCGIPQSSQHSILNYLSS